MVTILEALENAQSNFVESKRMQAPVGDVLFKLALSQLRNAIVLLDAEHLHSEYITDELQDKATKLVGDRIYSSRGCEFLTKDGE
jgi:hypothetical protein